MEQFAQITFFELINIEDILECHFKFYMAVSPKIFQIIRTTVSMNYRNWTAHCKHFSFIERKPKTNVVDLVDNTAIIGAEEE